MSIIHKLVRTFIMNFFFFEVSIKSITNFFVSVDMLVECKDGSCNKSITNDKKSKNITPSYTIVTGANANHFCELQNWLYYMSETSKRLPEKYRPRIIVYDLGIMKYQKKILNLLK